MGEASLFRTWLAVCTSLPLAGVLTPCLAGSRQKGWRLRGKEDTASSGRGGACC